MRDGDGPYTWITFSEAATSIKEFKAGLLELGLPGLYMSIFAALTRHVQYVKRL